MGSWEGFRNSPRSLGSWATLWNLDFANMMLLRNGLSPQWFIMNIAKLEGFCCFLCLIGIFIVLRMCVCFWKIPNKLTRFYHLKYASDTVRWFLVFQAPVLEVAVGSPVDLSTCFQHFRIFLPFFVKEISFFLCQDLGFKWPCRRCKLRDSPALRCQDLCY